MRVFGIIAAAAIAFAATGCTPADVVYLREGVGTDLWRSDLPNSTALQNLYLEMLCRQASPVIGAAADPDCGSGVAVPPALWPLIVQAGMNDIDLRCDSYLAWLDQRRRFNSAVIQEISDVRSITETLLAVQPGVGPRTIAAVGAAFGLASHTFTNINSLLLQVDHSTVQVVVFGRRAEFRKDIGSMRFDNRPAVIHALRSYLEICMPITIATDINVTVSVFQQAGPEALRAHRVIDSDTVAAASGSRTARVFPGGGERTQSGSSTNTQRRTTSTKTNDDRTKPKPDDPSQASVQDFELIVKKLSSNEVLNKLDLAVKRKPVADKLRAELVKIGINATLETVISDTTDAGDKTRRALLRAAYQAKIMIPDPM